MSEKLTLLKQETGTNPVHDLDSMVSWFAIHRDKYPNYGEVASDAREALMKVAEQAKQEEHEPLSVRLELRPPIADRDPDSVYYSEDPMAEGTYALISQIYRATSAEMVEEGSSYNEQTGDSYTPYVTKVGGQEIYLVEERTDGVTSLTASADIPKQPAQARLGSLVVVGETK